MPNLGTPKTSPSLGSGKAQAARTPFRGLRTTNPQSNFGTRLTLGRQSGAGGTGGARAANAPVQAAAVGGVGEVTLSWAAPTQTGGSEVTGYEIWRGATSNNETFQYEVGPVLTVDDTVAAGTYFYKIKAKSAVGTSAFSNEQSGTAT